MKKIFTIVILSFNIQIDAQCTLKAMSEYKNYNSQFNSTSNIILDQLIKENKIMLEKAFGVSVNMYACPGNNGQAMPYCNSNGCDGTIELGKELLLNEYNGPKGEMVIRCIIAHEFAHILQFRSNIKWPSSKFQELHADFIAGWYMSRFYKHINSDGLEYDLYKAFMRYGDYDYFSKNHHGEPLERAIQICDGLSWEYLSVDQVMEWATYHTKKNLEK